ncbi:MAG: nucleotidyltransferase family protein [Thermodesulfobacteriota bacterium]|nr:nucleotidyltransferase family protein [Thermodesulfobacteriota bacterium]
MPQLAIPGIILAAGRSLRMGKNKLLLTFRGKPILQHVIDAALQSSLSPLILVLGSDSDTIRSQVESGHALVIENHDFSCGYGFSLQAGLGALSEPCAGAMFLLGDQPLVTADTIEKLIFAFQKEPERWVAPSWNGQRGNPVITPAAWFDRIFALDGDTGPREHLKDPAAHLKLVDVDDRGVVFDIDSPEDYESVKKV